VFARGADAWRYAASWATWYGRNLIFCLTVGAAIHLLFDLSRLLFATPQRVRSWKPWQRTLFFSAMPLAGLLLGWPLAVLMAGSDVRDWGGSRSVFNIAVAALLLSLLMTFLLHHWFAARARQAEAEQRAAEAQLRLLQAQIEPHFLFNTLANVLSLIDHDTPRAKQMLQTFTDYLRSALAGLRSAQSPLAQELELAQNYLQLLAARMEDRLHFSIEADEAARRQIVPPLLLQPLIENAVQHGLEPTIDGGHVAVKARVEGDRLVIDVLDNGRGIGAAARRSGRPGSGLALANIRQRLLGCYGPAATLDVSPAHPGTLARISVPLERKTT